MNSIVRFFTKDFFRKCSALLLAILVWVGVKNRIGIEKTLPDKVNVLFTLPPDLVISNKNDLPKLRLRVKATQRQLSTLTADSFSIKLNINDNQYKENEPLTIIVKPSDIKPPLGVQVVSVENPKIILYLDKIITKQVSVKPTFSGSQDNYTTGQVDIKPSVITISGPSKSIMQQEFIATEPIPLSHMIKSFDYYVKLRMSKDIISMDKKVVKAHVEIIKSVDSIKYDNIPIRVFNDPENTRDFDLRIVPEVVTVFLSGPKDEIELITKEQVKPYIDVADFDSPGSYNVNINVSISNPKITVDKVLPPMVKLIVDERE